MNEVTVWHDTLCSKSRGVLSLLAGLGIEPEVRLYLEDPPTRGELEAVVVRLGGDARVLLRTAEAEQAGLAAATHDQILDAMAADPRLVERPVVLTADRAVLARPPERVHELFVG